MRHYYQCGLRIASELELALPRIDGDEADVTVRWGPEVDTSDRVPSGAMLVHLDDPTGKRWYTGTRHDGGFTMCFTDCGECVISEHLDEIVVHPDRSGKHDLLPVLVAGTVSSFLLALRGKTVLHASAVALGETAIAFVGQSGRGKSTVAALMCNDGARLITDDVLVIEPGEVPSCVGGAPELRLRAKAHELADGIDGASRRTTADDRLAFGPATADPRPFNLGTIVIPSPSRDSAATEATRLPPGEAVSWILRFPRVYGWSDPKVLVQDLSALSAVVNKVPVYNVTIPWGPPFSEEIAPAIADLVRG